MNQLQKGPYKTRAGHDAIVGKIKARGMGFVALGTIQDTETGVWHLHTWNIEGISFGANPFDLIIEDAA